MAGKSLTLDEFRALAGTEVGVSDWIEVPQEKINAFAEVTGDHQFIHVNEEMAKMTPFGGTIAHGFLSLSLLPVLMAKSSTPKVVDFPAPFSPSSVWISPGAMDREISSRATTPGKVLRIFWIFRRSVMSHKKRHAP